MSWLSPYLGPNPEMGRLQHDIGALLIGHRTFRGDDPNRGTDKEGAFGGTWAGPSIVLAHHLPRTAVPGVTVASDLESGLAAAKSAAGTATSTSWVLTSPASVSRPGSSTRC